MTTDLITNFYAAFPEMALLLITCILLFLSVFKRYKQVKFIYNMSVVGLGITIVMVNYINTGSLNAFNEMFFTNQFTQMAKTIILIISIIIVILIPSFLVKLQIYKTEIPILIMMANIGMMIMVSANNFLILYLGIELQSLALCILISMARHILLSTEAGLKYFVLSALSSIFMLYGISLIYGLTGSIFYAEIAKQLVCVTAFDSYILTGFVMIIVGICFKLSLAPFHMWTPDVYQGSPTAITVFLASAPKAAALFVLVQLLYLSFPTLINVWQPLLMMLGLFSIGLGSVAALFQINLKRFIAYSTISHMGYIALALLLPTAIGLTKAIVYLIVYSLTLIGTLTILLLFYRHGKSIEDINSLKGLSRDAPLLSFAFATSLFSLAGIPPFAGFFIKVSILQSVLDAGYTDILILVVLFSVISAAYYLKIIKYIYFDEPLGGVHALKIERGFSLPAVILSASLTVINITYMLIPIDKFIFIKDACSSLIPNESTNMNHTTT